MGAPKSDCLIGQPPAEWLRVMTWQDTLHAALQLQRDARLMSSNLTVLHQYAISLHWMSSEMLHSVFGRVFFPSTAVNGARAGAPRLLCVGTSCGYGPLAAPSWPWWSRSGCCSPGPSVFQLSIVSPVAHFQLDCLSAPVLMEYLELMLNCTYVAGC